MIAELKDALYSAVAENVAEKSVAVAFSGGVDSSVLAKICHDLGKATTLLTVGFPESSDVQFSSRIARQMGMPQKIAELNAKDFQNDLWHVRKLIGCSNTSHIENCVAYYYIARLANQNDFRIVLSANGCDELFCGYNGYRAVYGQGEAAIMKYMEGKLENEFSLVSEISMTANQFGVQVRQPFLSRKFIEYAKSIPTSHKIRGADDMIRKHVLREVATLIGVPEESAMKPKKAIQYGSLIHKHYKKVTQTGDQ